MELQPEGPSPQTVESLFLNRLLEKEKSSIKQSEVDEDELDEYDVGTLDEGA